MGKYYVYELVDPRDGSVFYVGKGSRDRIDSHEREARSGLHHPKNDRIRDIWSANGQVIKRRIFSNLGEDEAYRLEAERIKAIGLERLCNLVPGGRIWPSRTDECRGSIAEARKGMAALIKIAIYTNGFTAPCTWTFCGVTREVSMDHIKRFQVIFSELYYKWGDRILPKQVRTLHGTTKLIYA